MTILASGNSTSDRGGLHDLKVASWQDYRLAGMRLDIGNRIWLAATDLRMAVAEGTTVKPTGALEIADKFDRLLETIATDLAASQLPLQDGTIRS